MAEEPSHVQRTSLSHLFEIGLKLNKAKQTLFLYLFHLFYQKKNWLLPFFLLLFASKQKSRRYLVYFTSFHFQFFVSFCFQLLVLFKRKT